MPIFDKVNGVYRKVSKPYSNVNGAWRQDKKIYDRVNGVWREAFSGAIKWTHEIKEDNMTRITESNSCSLDFVSMQWASNFAGGYVRYTFEEPLKLPSGSSISYKIGGDHKVHKFGFRVNDIVVVSDTSVSNTSGDVLYTAKTYSNGGIISNIQVWANLPNRYEQAHGYCTYVYIYINIAGSDSFLLSCADKAEI